MNVSKPLVGIAMAVLSLSAQAAEPFVPRPIPPSDHFDGKRFFVPWLDVKPSMWNALKWNFSRNKKPWPDSVPGSDGPPPPAHVDGSALRITVVGHSTVLIQTEGLNILTDPIWTHAGPDSFLGLEFGSFRKTPPRVRFEDLPHIDLVLISHNHYDHLDMRTLKRLAAKQTPPPRILVGLGLGETVAEALKPEEMDWWEELNVGQGVSVTATPAQHWSRRGLWDTNRSLWMGFVIRTPGRKIFFAGDTGYGKHLSDIAARLGKMDVSLLPIGAYEPRWFMGPQHMDPDEAVRAHLDLKSTVSIGIHFDTFALADEGFGQAPQDLAQALRAHGVPLQRFIVPKFGEGIMP